MKKVSAEHVQEVFAEVPGVLRKLAAERDFYRTELGKITGRQRVEKLAGQMLEKGLESGDVRSIADSLEKRARSGEVDLTRLSDAVELVGTDMGRAIELTDEPRRGGAHSDLERFVLS